MPRILITALSTLLLFACTGNDKKNSEETSPETTTSNIPAPKNIQYSVINMYPHDTSSFTQGLVYYKNEMYEGTGQYKESKLKRLDYKTGKVEKQISLDTTLFGEGITILNDTLYQLTWKEHTVLVYSSKDFHLIKKLNWSNEGWGITNDGNNIIISDGSDKLYFVRPVDFKLMKVVSVTNNMGPVNNLNELEWIDGFIYANRWETDLILRIDPNSGQVVGQMDLTDALKKYANINYDEKAEEDGAVLNGIAWDSAGKRLFVTGKLWPKIFEVKLN